MRFFFYGTLMDPDVLHAVLGHRVSAGKCRPAVLPGYRRVYRRAATYPILVADAKSEVEGVVVAGLSPRDAERLSSYEGPEYVTAQLPIRLTSGLNVRAAVFLPGRGTPPSDRAWSPEEWRAQHRPSFLRRVRNSRRARSPEEVADAASDGGDQDDG